MLNGSALRIDDEGRFVMFFVNSSDVGSCLCFDRDAGLFMDASWFGSGAYCYSNQHVENVYLSCDELNIHNKEIYANDGNNFSYYVDVPKNISHFKLVARFEGEFPYISQRIVVDVNKV